MKVSDVTMRLPRTLLPVALAAAALAPALAVPRQDPAAPPAPTAKKEISEDEAVKIALKRVPGVKQGVPYTEAPQPYRVFIFSKEGKDCEVIVDRATGQVTKVLAPRLTKKQAAAIALKKAPGRVMEEASRYHADDGAHEMIIAQKGDSIATVLVSDKTGKVIKVTRAKDGGAG